jgi:acetyl esterase
MATLIPEAQAYIDQMTALGMQDYPGLGVDGARAQQARISAAIAPAKTGRSEDIDIPGPGGALPSRVFYPETQGPWPVLLAFHGGGWVMGNLESNDAFCRFLVREVGCLVISVNYRHAPEFKFPAPAEDAYAATAWAAANAAALGGDPARLGVFGTSAGGNLAAAVALMARDRGGPALACQLLIVPATDHRCDSDSYRTNQDGFGLTSAGMVWCWGLYLEKPEDGAHPYASPIRADDLSGLAPAIVVTAEFDPLRDDGAAYARALSAAGVPTIYKDYAGAIHSARGAQANVDVAEALRAAFAKA